VACVLRLIQMLPYRTVLGIADAIAWLARVLVPSRQRLAAGNIQRIFGSRYTALECRRIAAMATRHLCRAMTGLLKLPSLPPNQLQTLVTLEGIDHFQQAFAGGRGVIMLSAHYGAWEIMGARLVQEGIPITVLGTSSNSAARTINALRMESGLHILDPDDVRGMLTTLKQNGCLGILPDLRHCTPSSVMVDFMGSPALTAVGVATIALHAECAVVPVFCRHCPDGRAHVTIYPALGLVRTGNREADILQNTILFNRVIGEAIQTAPEQWYWLHNRWKTACCAEKMAPAAASAPIR
jgi:KDO2-lipid IV(A) lauroyltransferase